MKKSIYLYATVLAFLCLTAFGFRYLKNQNIISSAPGGNDTVQSSHCAGPVIAAPEDDIIYKVDQRFINSISMEEVRNAKSISDLVPGRMPNMAKEYFKMEVSSWPLDRLEDSEDTVLTAAQLDLLSKATYGSNLRVEAFYLRKDEETGELVHRVGDYLNYMLTVMPEHRAVYMDGQDALVKYLRDNSKKETKEVNPNWVKPCKILFTVTKQGTIEDVELEYTSGYPDVDEHLLKLVREIPGKWIAATDKNGEKVDQGLCFFFGQIGC